MAGSNSDSHFTACFERFEKKYILNAEQAQSLLSYLDTQMKPDRYPTGTNCSIYLDTDDHLLMRRSLQKPSYKEKLRLRSYGTPADQDPVFLEIKKKTGGIVYKRRISMTAETAMNYLIGHEPPSEKGQIFNEIDYMINHYGLNLSLMVNYERKSYAELCPSPDSLRITVDRNIRYRSNDLDLRHGDSGEMLLPPGTHLMEIKTARAIPIWLIRALEENHIRPVSFSKAGTAYLQTLHAASPLYLAV